MTLNLKNIDLTWFFDDFLAAKEWITTKWMEIDYDYLRTGTAIGFRASREFCSNYLFSTGLNSSLIIFIQTCTVNCRNALDRFHVHMNIILLVIWLYRWFDASVWYKWSKPKHAITHQTLTVMFTKKRKNVLKQQKAQSNNACFSHFWIQGSIRQHRSAILLYWTYLHRMLHECNKQTNDSSLLTDVPAVIRRTLFDRFTQVAHPVIWGNCLVIRTKSQGYTSI